MIMPVIQAKTARRENCRRRASPLSAGRRATHSFNSNRLGPPRLFRTIASEPAITAACASRRTATSATCSRGLAGSVLVVTIVAKVTAETVAAARQGSGVRPKAAHMATRAAWAKIKPSSVAAEVSLGCHCRLVQQRRNPSGQSTRSTRARRNMAAFNRNGRQQQEENEHASMSHSSIMLRRYYGVHGQLAMRLAFRQNARGWPCDRRGSCPPVRQQRDRHVFRPGCTDAW